VTTLKQHFEFALPMLLGLFFLIQGGVLAANADPLVRLVGFCLLLWVPGCSYYAWRGRTVWLRPSLTVEPTERHEQEQVDSRVAA
jgi:hypothetical protein